MGKRINELYTINGDQLEELVRNDILFSALESGGVDAWKWYDESIADFLDDVLGPDKYSRNYEGIEILVNKEMEAFGPPQKI